MDSLAVNLLTDRLILLHLKHVTTLMHPYMSASASSCEQNWNNFSFEHTDSWNRLTTVHACMCKLVCM